MPFDLEFDLARAVKSDAELESVRDSVRINERGFEIFFEHYAEGKSAADVMAAAEEYFVAEGCGRLTMNMVLPGQAARRCRSSRSPGKRSGSATSCSHRSRSQVPGMHWVEVSRAVAAREGGWSATTQEAMDAYEEYFESARSVMRAGTTAHDVHRAVSAGFTQRGFHLGHVTGHSIGMTMIEHPKIGEGVDTELATNMVFSMHPHAIAPDGGDCLYMQDTWLVTEDGGVPLSNLPMKIFAKA